MTVPKDKITDRPTLPMMLPEQSGDGSSVDTVLTKAYNDGVYDPKNGKYIWVLDRDGGWIKLPLDERGEFITN